MANNITSLQYSSVVVSAVLAAAGEPPRDPDSEAGKAYSALLEACQEFQEVELAQARAERWKERYLAGKAAAKARGSSLGGTPSLYTAQVRDMTAQGMSIAAIAKALDVSRNTVSKAQFRCRKAAAQDATQAQQAQAQQPSVPSTADAGPPWGIVDWIELCGG